MDVHPSSNSIVCSVGDDRLVAFWDTRERTDSPVEEIENAHGADINCCAWNPIHSNYVLTGSSDSHTHLYDWRRANTPVRVFDDEGIGEVRSINSWP